MGVLRLKVELRGWDWCLTAGIEALRLSLEAKIRALMRGGGVEREKGKISCNCESKGHWPLGIRCPKRKPTDQAINKPTNQPID